MSQVGQRPNDPAQVAAQLQAAGGQQRQAPQGQQPQSGAPGGAPPLSAVAQAYARCEQTKSCTPEDFQTLKAGLPNLMQMVQNIQKIVQVMSQQGGGQQQPPQQ